MNIIATFIFQGHLYIVSQDGSLYRLLMEAPEMLSWHWEFITNLPRL